MVEFFMMLGAVMLLYVGIILFSIVFLIIINFIARLEANKKRYIYLCNSKLIITDHWFKRPLFYTGKRIHWPKLHANSQEQLVFTFVHLMEFGIDYFIDHLMGRKTAYFMIGGININIGNYITRYSQYHYASYLVCYSKLNNILANLEKESEYDII